MSYFRKKVNAAIDFRKYVLTKKLKCIYKGDDVFICSPFYEDRTPSCSVNSDKKVFYCFGTHTSGDLVYLISRIEDKPIDQIVFEFAQRNGVEFPKDLSELDSEIKKEAVPMEHINLFLKYDIERMRYTALCDLLYIVRSSMVGGVFSEMMRFYFLLNDSIDCTLNNLEFLKEEIRSLGYGMNKVREELRSFDE